MSVWEALLSAITKYTWRLWFGLAFAIGIVLLFQSRLGIQQAVPPWHPWLVVGFILSVGVLLTYLGSAVYPWGAACTRGAVRRHREKKYLQTLTDAQKHILQRYTDERSRTAYLKMNDGVVAALYEHGIVDPAPVHLARGSTMAYNISSTAWEHLVVHPELVATPTNPRPKPTGNEWLRD